MKDCFRIENLGCSIGPRSLFDGLGVTLSPGCLLVVKGENGSGKTTFLQAVAGIRKPASGCFAYPEGVTQPLYISHRQGVNPDFTVREMMEFWAGLLGDDKLIAPALHYFDLEPYADFRCGDLSMGWRQRVSLSRLLYIPSSLWVLDEPTSHLDDAGISLFNSLVISRIEQGGIVVMSTHAQIFNDDIKVLYINDFV